MQKDFLQKKIYFELLIPSRGCGCKLALYCASFPLPKMDFGVYVLWLTSNSLTRIQVVDPESRVRKLTFYSIPGVKGVC